MQTLYGKYALIISDVGPGP